MIKILLILLAAAVPISAAGPAAGAGAGSGRFALTFDDGPGYVTGDLLKLLDQRKAKATFFMLGSAVRAKPELVKMLHAAGHLVANHTDTHKNWFAIGKTADREKVFAAELGKAEAAIIKATGEKPKILRMPNGYTAPWVREAAKRLGYTTANWSYGSDWSKTPEARMTAEYVKAVKPGAVLLLHDGGGKNREKTLRITAAILDEAQRQGLQPVRLDALRAGPAPRE